MSNFFEEELRKLFGDGTVISSPHFAGQACIGTLGSGLKVRAQFVTTTFAEQYDALKITVLNRQDGPVDTLSLKLRDIWGKKTVPGNPNFKNGVSPHIWIYDGKAKWYAYQPTQADRTQLLEAVRQYLEPFQVQTRTHSRGGSKLVYICAPLRGDMEKNIAFARQKAQEVFQAGDIPVCPHLMFPPIADPENPQQDQAARDMGLRLVEACQEIRVFGMNWTEGMWAEINHAMNLGIRVKTDRKPLEHTPHRKQSEKGAR